jgi:hypothetical protein
MEEGWVTMEIIVVKRNQDCSSRRTWLIEKMQTWMNEENETYLKAHMADGCAGHQLRAQEKYPTKVEKATV